jgi:hypothetical protein
MSGLLFLISIIGFVVVAFWAFKNDAMGLNEQGSGLLAMRASTDTAPKAGPKWKKEARQPTLNSRRLAGPKANGDKKPRWNQAFLPKRDR